MALTRKAAATAAIAALVVPFAATVAHSAEAPPQPRAVSLVVAAQTYHVAASAQEQSVGRDAFVVYTPPPPPPAPVVEPATAAAATTDSSPGVTAPQTYAGSQDYSGENIVAYAQQFVGVVPYGAGNNPNDSFSCDGLVQYVFAHFGVSLPRGADYQAALGTVISPAEARAGDLLWYPGQHIGIYDGSGGMIDSPDWGRYVEHRAIWGSPVYVRL